MVKYHPMEFTIDDMRADDWAEVRAIYLEGIATGNATFETAAPDWHKWDVSHLPVCRLVARAGTRLLGWAALSAVSARAVYAGVAEVSIYIAEASRGKGVGRALLATLIERSERANIWTLQAGILAENAASITLHKSVGFREVGRRERIGKLHGLWRDILLLERRSNVID